MPTNQELPKIDESRKDQPATAELEQIHEELKHEDVEKIAGGGHGKFVQP